MDPRPLHSTLRRCPSDDELSDFSSGRLAIQATEAIARHLSHCNRCQDFLETLDQNIDPLVESLRSGLQAAPLDAVECDRIIQLVAAISPDTNELQADDRVAEGTRAQRTGPPTLNVRCPYCQNTIDVGDSDPLEHILCAHCETRFRLAGDSPANNRSASSRWNLAHFELLDQVGMGRFGSVWKARDTLSGETVAVKIPRRGELATAETEQFLREARSAAQVQHPNVVHVREVGREGESIYIVSDFVDGLTLKDWLDGQPSAPRLAAELCAVLAEALHAAHTAGVVHRDLKPANILIDADRMPHITDFGLARREATDVTITAEGQILGTPAYMSPEQARGKGHQADPRSDIYSLGVILFEMLIGQPPFRGDTHMLVPQILWDEPPRLRKLSKRIPRDLETICLKCLEKRPARRYQSAADLAEDLQRFLKDSSIRARPVSQVGRLTRLCKRRPLVTALASITCATIVALFAVIFAAYLNTSTALKEIERNLYFHEIAAARSKWLSNDPERAAQSLDACPPAMRGFEWGYLKGLQNSAVRKLQNSGGCVAYSPEGNLIATGGGSLHLLRIWDGDTGKQLHCLQGHTSFLSGLDFSPDGRIVASAGGQDGTIRLWDAVEGLPLGILGRHERSAIQPYFSADGTRIVSRGGDPFIRIWSLAEKQEVLRIEPGPLMIRAITLSPVDNLVAVAAGRTDKILLALYNFDTGEKLHEFPAGKRAFTSAAFSPDGTLLAASEYNGIIRIWDIASHGQVALVPGPFGRTPSITFSPDGRRIAGIAWDGAIHISDVETGGVLNTLRGRVLPAGDIRFSPNGRSLACGSVDNTVRIWDTETDQGTIALAGPNSRPTYLTFSHHTNCLAASFENGTIKAWDAASGKPRWTPSVDARSVRSLSFSPDGHRLATADKDNKIRIYDMDANRILLTMEQEGETTGKIAFSPDGTLLASSGHTRRVLIRDSRSGELVHTLSTRGMSIGALAFHPGGQLLATGNVMGKLDLWSLPSGKLLRHNEDQLGITIDHLAFSPDGKILAIARRGGTVQLLDPATGDYITTFGDLAYDAPVAISFSIDSRRLVTTTRHMALSLWDIPSGRATLSLARRPTLVDCVAFHPNGRMIASAEFDGTIRIWKAAPYATPSAQKLVTDSDNP